MTDTLREHLSRIAKLPRKITPAHKEKLRSNVERARKALKAKRDAITAQKYEIALDKQRVD